MSFPDTKIAHGAITSAAIMSNGLALFNIIGDILITSLHSECYAANDATVSRITYQADTAHNGIVDISGLTGSLASAAAGTRIICDNTSLNSIPNISLSGVSLNMDSRGIVVPEGALIISVIGGSTTGLWKHYIRWEPLEDNAYVLAAF